MEEIPRVVGTEYSPDLARGMCCQQDISFHLRYEKYGQTDIAVALHMEQKIGNMPFLEAQWVDE